MDDLRSLRQENKKEFLDEILKQFIAFSKEDFGIDLYESQIETAIVMFESVFFSHKDVYMKMARQGGKTEVLTLIVRFLIINYREIMDDPLMVAFASPQGEQAKTDIDRIKKTWDILKNKWRMDDREFNKNTIRAYVGDILMAEVYRFSLAPTTRNESKTINLLIVEEAHNVDDIKREDELDPMLVSTGGPSFFLGVGCTRLCDFKRGCDGEKSESVALLYDCDRLIADRFAMYKRTGDTKHLSYAEKIKSAIAKKGRENPQVKRNYFLEDTVEEGGFISRDRLLSCHQEGDAKVDQSALYVGIDFGRRVDFSWVCVTNVDKDVVNWFKYPHIETEDQLKMIWEDLKQYKGRIMAIRGDSTGAGDMPMEWLMRHTDLPMGEQSHYIFGPQSKHDLYTHFENCLFKEKGTDERFSYPANHPLASQFEEEMINLHREYRGDRAFLAVNHPPGGGTHDDSADATSLSLIASASGKIGDIIF